MCLVELMNQNDEHCSETAFDFKDLKISLDVYFLLLSNEDDDDEDYEDMFTSNGTKLHIPVINDLVLQQ